MTEDKPENKPEFGGSEGKSEFDKPESKSEFDRPEAKSEFDVPKPKSEFDQPEGKLSKVKPIPKPKFKKDKQPSRIRFRFKFFFIFFILASGIYFGTGPAIEAVAKFVIARVFEDSVVTIGGLSIKPTHQISFLNVGISRGEIYDIVVKEANLDFTWPGILKKVPPGLNLNNVKFTSNSSNTKLSDLIDVIKIKEKRKLLTKFSTVQAKPASGGKPKSQAQGKTKTAPAPALLNKIDITDLNIELDILDAKVNALVSLSLNLADKKLSFLDVNARQLNIGMIALRGLDLNALQGQRGKGTLKVWQANLGNLKIQYIKSKAVLEGMILSLDGIAGKFLSKKITGEMTLNLWPTLECTANAKVGAFSAAALAKELGWENKIELSGKLYAKTIFRSEGKAMAMLNLSFISSPAGATLTISDPEFLRAISRQSRKPLTEVSESFNGYGYRKGQLIGSLLEDALNLKIILAGQQGRRNLNFNLKDVNIFGAN